MIGEEFIAKVCLLVGDFWIESGEARVFEEGGVRAFATDMGRVFWSLRLEGLSGAPKEAYLGWERRLWGDSLVLAEAEEPFEAGEGAGGARRGVELLVGFVGVLGTASKEPVLGLELSLEEPEVSKQERAGERPWETGCDVPVSLEARSALSSCTNMSLCLVATTMFWLLRGEGLTPSRARGEGELAEPLEDSTSSLLALVRVENLNSFTVVSFKPRAFCEGNFFVPSNPLARPWRLRELVFASYEIPP